LALSKRFSRRKSGVAMCRTAKCASVHRASASFEPTAAEQDSSRCGCHSEGKPREEAGVETFERQSRKEETPIGGGAHCRGGYKTVWCES